MSKVTLFSLLLAVLLGTGIRLSTGQQRDACTPYLDGDSTAPRREWVVSGTRQIVVPCNDWFARQPLRVQSLCLLDAALAVLFFFNSLFDLRDWLAARRRRRTAAALESSSLKE